jgi:hypothetical protein
LPVDEALLFASGQTITATGYVNNVQAQINLGSASGVGGTYGAYGQQRIGRKTYLCCLEILTAFDTAPASAQRMVPTIAGASPAIPDTGRSGSLLVKPFWNLGQGSILYAYSRLYCVVAGTTPSLTITAAWCVPFEMRY